MEFFYHLFQSPITWGAVCVSRPLFSNHTVDGRNPAPVDMVNITLFTGFYRSQVVVSDFWTINSINQLLNKFSNLRDHGLNNWEIASVVFCAFGSSLAQILKKDFKYFSRVVHWTVVFRGQETNGIKKTARTNQKPFTAWKFFTASLPHLPLLGCPWNLVTS